MKLAAVSALVAAGVVVAQDGPASVVSSKMQRLMDIKMAHRAQQIANGAFAEDTYADQGFTACKNGRAGEFACENVDLMSFLSHQTMKSQTREGNDVWGWTSSTGREFGLVGQTDGTAFVEVKSDGTLQYLGRLPTQSSSSTWRDIKVIGNYAYIGSEASRHGLQVFDLTKLLALSPSSPKTFSISSDLTAHHNGFSNSHNIVANSETNMIYAVGSNQCSGGLYMLDVKTPSNPKFVGCVSEDKYVHDAQCVVYSGVDQDFVGHEICFNFNEDTLTIVDVTDKSNPVQLSRTGYQGAAYTHQGWLATKDMRYILLDDELDELDGTTEDTHTTTYIFDVGDLTKPKYTGKYKSPAYSIDHNQYVVLEKGLSFQSNYGSGLRIVDVSSVSRDPTAKGFKQAGFFDCDPSDDGQTAVAFQGSWSVYPWFESGYILLNSIERGLFLLRYTG